MSKKIVIVGGVAGGAGTAARYRRLDEEAEIILIERGPHISFANCGLPYFLGDVITNRNALLLVSPEEMRGRFRVDVRTLQEVLSIDPKNKTVEIKKRAGGEIYTESYDTLVLATGSSPLKPPIPGIDSEGIFQLWTVRDAENIKDYIDDVDAERAIVVGGGFIGLEAAENLRKAGLSVSLVEMAEQVMPPFDPEMAKLLHKELRANGVELCLGDGVASLEKEGDTIRVHTQSGKVLEAELVILAIGVKPNSQLAKDAGIRCNERGGIIVNDMLRTSEEDIYAVGDVIEVRNPVNELRCMTPLAGPANKQARIAGSNLAGKRERYEGTQGTSILKLFGISAACTGENEKSLLARGLVKGEDYESLIISQRSHAKYYPDPQNMIIKLLFSKNGKRIYGAQIVGKEGVDKRIDVLATVIRLCGTVEDLCSLELAYAPPFNGPKDPINMLGFAAENYLEGMTDYAPYDVMETEEDVVALEIREAHELHSYTLPIPHIHIPFAKLRSELDKLNKEDKIVIFCSVGARAHGAAQLLKHYGFRNVRVYPGGVNFYKGIH